VAVDLVLFGPPGAGKGTQGMRLARALGLAHVSTGDMLREAVRSDSALGREVKQRLDSGRFVDDAVVDALVADRLATPSCAAGVVLDGYPRNLTQVASLDRSLTRLARKLHAALFMEVPEAAIVSRLSGRRSCSGCNAPYHLESKPPRLEGRCDLCGEALAARPDDAPEVVRGRLDVYRRETEPLVRAYAERSLLRRVDGTGGVDAVADRLLQAVGGAP